VAPASVQFHLQSPHYQPSLLTYSERHANALCSLHHSCVYLDAVATMWRRLYFLLILVRIYFALSPSYLHPDENFQGPEVIAGIPFSESSLQNHSR
jgi:hypothetical protein